MDDPLIIRNHLPLDTHITLDNEWLDLLNSPSARKSPMVNPQHKYQTPVKLKKYDMITPMSDKEETVSIDEKTPLSPPKVVISDWDIFWKIINTIVGKDKLAKVSQYSLRLIIYHAKTLKTSLLAEKIDLNSLPATHSELFQYFLSEPQLFIKSVLLFLCNLVGTNLTGLTNGLGLYRQFLRFGKSPFKIRLLGLKLHKLINLSKMSVDPSLFTKKTIGDFTGLYYCIHDEMGLLYKLKFYNNKAVQQYCSKHEAIGWYSETILALYNTWDSLSSLSQQEIDMKIQIQVKQKAKLLSKQILSNNNISLNFPQDRVSTTDLKTLSDLQFKKNNAWLDVYKNLSDLCFNTYTVFNIPLSFPTIQIWMGISASTLSIVKIYRETKKSMIEQELAKLR